MFYHGHPAGSVCPAGGQHDPTGSGSYTLFMESPPHPAQGGWRWCFKCQTVFYGELTGSVCPVDNGHSSAISPPYFMPTETFPDSQDQWRWCRKCQVLWYGGGTSAGVCAAGGEHSKEGSGDYRVHVAPDGGIQPMTYYIHSHLGNVLGFDRILGRSDKAGVMLTTKRGDQRWRLSWKDKSTFYLRPVAASEEFLAWRDAPYMLETRRTNDYDNRSYWFTVDVTSPGWVAINNIDHSKVMDVRYGNSNPGEWIIAWPWNGGQNQMWCMAPYA